MALWSGSVEIRLRNGGASLELATMTTLLFGSKAMPLARAFPPVSILAFGVPDFVSRTVMELSPSLTQTSAPPLTTTMPFGPEVLPLFATPTNPEVRET